MSRLFSLVMTLVSFGFFLWAFATQQEPRILLFWAVMTIIWKIDAADDLLLELRK